MKQTFNREFFLKSYLSRMCFHYAVISSRSSSSLELSGVLDLSDVSLPIFNEIPIS